MIATEAPAWAALGHGLTQRANLLDAVLKESLRLHPVIPMVVRTLLKPTTLRVMTVNTHKGFSALNRRFVLAELRGRAEDVTLRADVATARAVAPLDRLAELAVRVVRPGGLVLAIKGQTADAELRKARPVLRRIDARGAKVVRAGQGKVDPATTVVRFFAT